MKIKICGMKYKDNIESVAALQPDYLGFIFFQGSKRNFHGEIPTLSADIKKTGVFVNEEESVISDLIQKHELTGIQLHGDESPAFCAALKASNNPNLEIIKAFAVSDHFDFDQLTAYKDVCDYFLFDTKGKERGGNGTLFDWTLLEQYPLDKPFFLSGGIGLTEVDRVLSFLESPSSKYCHALDLNSKFESEPGLKKIHELKKFIELAKKY